MTCGIYKLKFNGTDKVYIGKSVNIESRYSSHRYSLNKGISSKKLQEAYSVYGVPTMEVCVICVPEKLDTNEILIIGEYNSIANGFNTAKGGSSTGSGYGYDNYNVLYDKSVYAIALNMLVNTKLTTKDISERLDIKVNIVRDICNLSSHSWLKLEYPIEYLKLESMNRNSYLHMDNRANKVSSPDGMVFEVLSIRNFAKEHGLTESGLSKLLHGSRRVHKGWKLESTKIPTHYPEIVSPENIMYAIPIGKAKEFALSNGLTQSSLQRLLTGKVNSHKGWKLASKIIDLKSPVV